MSSAVKLYVYDLSNGMARQLSRQLTGRQIDGIWHTSVVVFGKEIFYGQGINTTLPGRSHHGQPMEVIDMGETMIDEETFGEYLQEIRQHYTADKYHLLEFNCNSFTNDCIGFLTGNSIPSYIKDLPTDFLSTPFGAALRPTIDAMYRRPTPGMATAPPTSTPNPQLAASILQSVASQAQAQAPSPRPTSALASPIHVSTNPASFHAILRTHRATIADFTSASCPPCRMIEPVFDRLAQERGGPGIAFVRVDLGVGQGSAVAAEWAVRVTPTFIFFLDGKKINEMKGADATELGTLVDLLLYQAFPPHPHTSLSLPAFEALSLSPILFSQVPALDVATNKLLSFIDSSSHDTPAQTKTVLTKTVLPYLKARSNPKSAAVPATEPSLMAAWGPITLALCESLDASQLFPLTDLWRLAILDLAVSAYLTSVPPKADPLRALMTASSSGPAPPRASVLTALRLACNAFASRALARVWLGAERRKLIGGLVVPALLHEDVAVRTAAASLGFNVGACVQSRRVERVRGGRSRAFEGVNVDEDEDEEWEVEMISAIVEALVRETSSEEIIHRLTASLACFVRLSPNYESQIAPLLEVLQVRSVLRSKLVEGGCGEAGVVKKEARSLIEEVAAKLCP